MVCNCTLAGTKACLHCSNYTNYFGDKTYYTFSDRDNYNFEFNIKKYKPSVQYWCAKCDALLDKYDRFCHNCGAEQDWSDFEGR